MMHIIESGDVAKPVTTLVPLTKLSSNDAYYSTQYVSQNFEKTLEQIQPDELGLIG